MNGYDAESALAKALGNARAANEPQLEQRILQLLPKARGLGEDPARVLQDVEEVLDAYGESADPDLLYTLFSRQAQAREFLGRHEEALVGLQQALERIPENAPYQRTRIRATVARIYADRFEWEEAKRILRDGLRELGPEFGSAEAIDKERSAALIKLVQANIHQSLGQDEAASTLYEECAAIFEKFGDGSFVVAALQGFVDCGLFLGYSPTRDTMARLRDYASISTEYREAADKEREGILSFAADQLFKAQNELLEALTAAENIHNLGMMRSSQKWYAEVLLKANHKMTALEQFVLAGDRERASKIAEEVVDSLPLGEEDAANISAFTIDSASRGDLRAQGAALAALRFLADIVPDDALTSLSEYLSTLDELPSSMMEGRNLRSEAGRLAATFIPRFSEEQAVGVGEALIRTICRRDGFWTSYAEACLALATLFRAHTKLLNELEVPLERLVELVDDVVSDRHNAMTALINMALEGHDEARGRALEVLRSGTTISHVGWRYLLHDTSEEEVVNTIRNTLSQSISSGRVRELEGGTQVISYGLSPAFLHTFDLPEQMKAEVARELAEAATDSYLLIPHREAAISILGSKAAQLGRVGRLRAIEALMNVISASRIQVHPMLQSTDDPLSGFRMNIGSVENLGAVAAESLLALSHWMDDDRREILMQHVEKLRASRKEAYELAISKGLKHFDPRTSEEATWLYVRLLLLLNASRPEVRRNAALSLGNLIREENIHPYPELLYTVTTMAASQFVKDRIGAAFVLVQTMQDTNWHFEETIKILSDLRNDMSHSVREAASTNR